MVLREIKSYTEFLIWLADNWKKHWGKILIAILVIIAVIILKDIIIYSKHQKVALLIYPEISLNTKKIKKLLDKEQDFYESKAFGAIFIFSSYKDYYKDLTLNKNALDGQLANFYKNLENPDVQYSKHDLRGIKEQGEDILSKLSFYFGCKDIIALMEQREKREYKIVSEDPGIPIFSPICYLRYKFK